MSQQARTIILVSVFLTISLLVFIGRAAKADPFCVKELHKSCLPAHRDTIKEIQRLDGLTADEAHIELLRLYLREEKCKLPELREKDETFCDFAERIDQMLLQRYGKKMT